MLSADLAYGATAALTLTFDDVNDEFQLIDSLSAVIDSAAAADAETGGIVITGTSGDDSLELDLDTLLSETITFSAAAAIPSGLTMMST